MTLHHRQAVHGRASSSAVPDVRPLECREVVAGFWDYLDGNFSSEFAERITAHAAVCTPCRRLRRYEERFLELLAQVRRRSPAPRGVHDRVRRALAAERRAGEGGSVGRALTGGLE